MQNATGTRRKAAPSDGSDALERKVLLAALRSLRRGEFTSRLPDGLTGTDGRIAETFNDIALQMSALESELRDVRNAVGKEGRTKRRVQRSIGRNGWENIVASVNEVVDDVTGHAADLSRVAEAVMRGDFSVRVDIEGRAQPLHGASLREAETVNKMAAHLELYTQDLIRLALEVGVDGKLGAESRQREVTGGWLELGSAVNLMAANLTAQLREIARVTTAVAQGDLSKTIEIEVRGEILELKHTINTMVGQLRSFSDEVTRVAREVGTEGILGGQARVRGVSGVWRDLTESVNFMADNLTTQVRNIAEVSTAIARGDLSRKITVAAKGEIRDLAATINTMVDQLSAFASEVTRVAREVGTEGVLGGQAQVAGASGVWRELTQNVNSMANNLTSQVRNIAEVINAIAEGDLGSKITVDARGEILALKNTINATVDKLNGFAAEVTRVARLVGTEGTLGVQAEVRDVSGIWKDLTDSVNHMGRNLTDQVRDIAAVTTAVATGDLSRKITVEVNGEILALKNTINNMVDTLSSFADEVTRMAREVGTEGVLGGQAEVPDVSGVWKELTDNVNSMANNLTNQVRNISEVASAVASGDLSRKITVDARGEVQDLKETLNAMVDQLNSFAAQVNRVAREVGVDGRLGGQAVVDGVRGTWKELTDNVNLMASNLTNQVRDIAEVTTAVARGDLTRKIAVDARGEILELKNTINIMVEQLGSFADQVIRLAREVGVEGKLGGQADVRGVSGTWRQLTDAVNSMANNLTDQVRNISQVATAIARGDLNRKIVVDARGEILELKNTINIMVDQLSSFAEEVTRVAREVGSEGRLGGQASVEGVRGTWKELTDNVNQMAGNLTNQVRDIAQVATAIARGELNRKVSVEVRGEILELKNIMNTMVDQLSSFADEVTRVAREVGVEGKLGGQARVRGASGIWKELTDNVNLMGSNLTDQVRDIAEVTTAVATGDLSRKITVEVRGEILELKNTINVMVDQLRSFADEVTRVAREVGTEGVLGGQAEVRGVSGTWRELTDNVNFMARNLTAQVRGIARVVTAVARGDLDQELRLDARGEIAELVDTINGMTDTLSVFAEQVTGVARDVGVEGRLGGQADVPGAAGVWSALVSNVNELAGNLTRQVRAIGDVATSVTKGDLSRSITVEARGEVALLKDNINQMIHTLAETTRVNQEQDWLKTNLAHFTRMLQGQRDLLTVAQKVLYELASVVGAQHGAFYMADKDADETVLQLFASYAFVQGGSAASRFRLGEGLVGQSAIEKKRIMVPQAPAGYVQITSGLGAAAPMSIVVVPVLFESDVKGVIELATFDSFTPVQLAFLEQLLESLGIVVATIEATMRTDSLLRQSQRLTEELQSQQEELQQTNEALEEKARQLSEQKAEVERKNREVETAKRELEEKAEQLALTSRYKSEFLANMSHELRTPLNSLLMLSRQLSDNVDHNLTDKQVRYAQTIYQSGADLLALINEILDLAKIESGTMAVDASPVRLSELTDYVERTFRHLAIEKGLELSAESSGQTPETIETDDMRLRQVLRNLLSNAIKFTECGEVSLQVCAARSLEASPASVGEDAIAFVVKDTGIGIARDKQRIIFEAFQQADGSTSRRYGGTGLGLSISRELTALLGGELSVQSEPGQGSTFTLFLPRRVPRTARRVATRADVLLPETTLALPAPMLALSLPEIAKVADDRALVAPGDRVLLIIDSDPVFAELLLGLARDEGLRGVVSLGGREALELARGLRPEAITLDLRLPDIDGWVVLDRLKHSPETRHIPVQVIGALEDERRALENGAFAVLCKPATHKTAEGALHALVGFLEKRVRQLLVVEQDAAQCQAVIALIGGDDVLTTAVRSGEEALSRLTDDTFDCIVVGLRLPGVSGFELIERIRQAPQGARTPIIVYTAHEPTSTERAELSRMSASVLVRDVRSPERLLEESARFLHRPEADLPEPKRELLKRVAQMDPLLSDRRVLLVDDDLRNIFALTALLEQHKMLVYSAENGREALELLAGEDVDVVLMDIMMPEMDGYEAIRRIRKDPRHAQLPVIALTAKAMAGDRDACIEAGASDYITKPVELSQLLSLLRVWLYGRGHAA